MQATVRHCSSLQAILVGVVGGVGGGETDGRSLQSDTVGLAAGYPGGGGGGGGGGWVGGGGIDGRSLQSDTVGLAAGYPGGGGAG